MERHHLAHGRLNVDIEARGAQLSSLRDRRWGELLWQAGPVWPQHAPNLFPIVGQLKDDRYLHDGRSYTLTRHGFARGRLFEWIECDAQHCRLLLRDDEQTRAMYPFAFEVEISYSLADSALHVQYTLRNPGRGALPASVGAHPAFRWPLVDGVSKDAHRLRFECPEPAPIRRLQNGLLGAERLPTPIDGRVLSLREQLFAADAIVMDRVASRCVRYDAPGTVALVVGWSGFRELGLWSKGDGAFLCIEPWAGYASPVDFDGPFESKPGLLHVPPGSQVTLELSIAVEDP